MRSEPVNSVEEKNKRLRKRRLQNKEQAQRTEISLSRNQPSRRKLAR